MLVTRWLIRPLWPSSELLMTPLAGVWPLMLKVSLPRLPMIVVLKVGVEVCLRLEEVQVLPAEFCAVMFGL